MAAGVRVGHPPHTPHLLIRRADQRCRPVLPSASRTLAASSWRSIWPGLHAIEDGLHLLFQSCLQYDGGEKIPPLRSPPPLASMAPKGLSHDIRTAVSPLDLPCRSLALFAAIATSPARADQCDDVAKQLAGAIDGLKVNFKAANIVYLDASGGNRILARLAEEDSTSSTPRVTATEARVSPARSARPPP